MSVAETYPAPTSGDVLANITIDQLSKKHPEHHIWATKCDDYQLLYKGGEEFLRAAGSIAIMRAQYDGQTAATAAALVGLPSNLKPRRFLYQLEGEPDTKYFTRWERAVYLGYMGAIIDYFRHYLFSQPPIIRPAADKDEVETPDFPDWWEGFFENCDGAGTDLFDFVKEAFGNVLIDRRAGWLIGTPGNAGDVQLTPYRFHEIRDWQDTRGELDWVVLCKNEHRREFPQDRLEVETYTYVDRERWKSWEVRKDDKGDTLEEIGGDYHNLGIVPFVMLEVPYGLWPANKLASWQIDLFNKFSMLSYGQLVSCFLQPYLKSNDPGAGQRVFGEGILLNLRAADATGKGEEEFGWASPDTKPLEFTSAQLKEQRDEGYRIVHQMSLAVDSQAVGAIARSGASKIEDRRATEVILGAYGGYVREALERTATLISLIQGDGLEWMCDGFDNFQINSLDEELQAAALFETLSVKAPTAKKLVMQNLQTSRGLVGFIDEATRNKIKDEIDESVDEAEEAQMMGPQLRPDTPAPENEDAALNDLMLTDLPMPKPERE